MTAAGSVAAQQSTAGPAHTEALAYWTTGYAGAELAGTGCAVPLLPAESALSGAQRKAERAIRTWRECHRRRMGSLAPEAAYKHIPAGVFDMMTPAERDAAITHVAAVHAKLADAVQAQASKAIAGQNAWRAATRRYLDDYHDRFIAWGGDR